MCSPPSSTPPATPTASASNTKHVANRNFTETHNRSDYRFTWRTISTWLYRFKKRGITTLDNKTRADRDLPRKVTVPQLAEAQLRE